MPNFIKFSVTGKESFVQCLQTILLLINRAWNFMEKSMPKLDSHVIDYFLNMAEHMEEHLDDQTYVSVKKIFNREVLMIEEGEDS